MKTPGFHCHGPGFNAWSGNLRYFKECNMAKKKEKKKKKVWPLIKYWITALQTQKESEWRRK